MSVERANRVVELLRSELKGLEEEIVRRTQECKEAERIVRDHMIAKESADRAADALRAALKAMGMGEDPTT